MNDILINCNKIESSAYIETNNKTRIITNVGYLITTNYEIIINMCKNTIDKMRFNKTRNDEIFVSHVNKPSTSNIIITQPYLIAFWENFQNEKLYVISNLSKFKKNVFSQYSIVIISHPLLNQQIHQIYKMSFNRVVLHNCHKKYFHKIIQCNFKWFVFSDEHTLNNSIRDTSEEILQHILVNDEQDTNNVTKHIIFCKKPIESLTLEGLVDKTIIDSVDKFNIKHIIKHLTDSSIKSEKDVIRYVLRRFNEQIKNIETNEHCIELMLFASYEDKKKKLDNLYKKKNVINEKKNELIKRITENNLCFICYSNIDIKTILKCCSNNVCFECINKWIKTNNTCPLCKKSEIQYFLVEDDHAVQIRNITNLNLSEENSIFENFQLLVKQLLTRTSKSKIAIIGYEQMFIRKFENILTTLNLSFLKFKGNNHILKNKLDKLNYEVDIIFIDCSRINCGIPINNITDIIILSKDFDVNAFNRQCKSVTNNWFLLYK
ncbi:hypothetical protein QKU58_gp148 [Pyramimonas orientalis virus]|uniref:RING-type domain-containing protein n=1 Tax=Pyramimonas orientalis virus 01B TaxID=3134525 RepID=A0A7M4CES3_9VIRU|nr:hypothetical protein QKU58_gp148 [Pyramimonas orientalis virus]QOI90183.1 hypothetical protein HWQ62_00046 [Pyramimonas orientalis virus]